MNYDETYELEDIPMNTEPDRESEYNHRMTCVAKQMMAPAKYIKEESTLDMQSPDQ